MSDEDQSIYKKFKRTKRIQLAAIGGVCVAIGVILGILTSFLPGLGPKKSDKKNPIQASTESSTPSVLQPKVKDPKPDKTVSEKKPVVPVDTVHITVDEDRYILQTTKNDKPVETNLSLKEVVELVKKAKGNKEGIKIQIKILKSARYLTENGLKEALSKAEIPTSAIAVVEE